MRPTAVKLGHEDSTAPCITDRGSTENPGYGMGISYDIPLRNGPTP